MVTNYPCKVLELRYYYHFKCEISLKILMDWEFSSEKPSITALKQVILKNIYHIYTYHQKKQGYCIVLLVWDIFTTTWGVSHDLLVVFDIQEIRNLWGCYLREFPRYLHDILYKGRNTDTSKCWVSVLWLSILT